MSRGEPDGSGRGKLQREGVEAVGGEGIADVDSIEAGDGADDGEAEAGGAFAALRTLIETVEDAVGVEGSGYWRRRGCVGQVGSGCGRRGDCARRRS